MASRHLYFPHHHDLILPPAFGVRVPLSVTLARPVLPGFRSRLFNVIRYFVGSALRGSCRAALSHTERFTLTREAKRVRDRHRVCANPLVSLKDSRQQP